MLDNKPEKENDTMNGFEFSQKIGKLADENKVTAAEFATTLAYLTAVVSSVTEDPALALKAITKHAAKTLQDILARENDTEEPTDDTQG